MINISCIWSLLFVTTILYSRSEEENCCPWSWWIGGAPQNTRSHRSVWAVRCNCKACFGGKDMIVCNVVAFKGFSMSLTGLFQHYFPRAMIEVWIGLHFILQCHWLYLELMTDKSSSGEWMVLIIVLTFVWCILAPLCVIVGFMHYVRVPSHSCH